MAAEESLIHLLHLFDSFWFENQTLKNNSNPPVVSPVLEDDYDKPKLALISTRDDEDHTSIMMTSNESLSSGGSYNLLSPNSVLLRSRVKVIQTILSGKESGEVPEENQQEKKVINTRRRKRRGKGLSSKSLTELEFEELKGFMDLGFVFSEGDKNSSLVEIIPGLQRFGKQEEDENNNNNNNSVTASFRQPYLSQAWEIMEIGRKEPEKLKCMKINADVNNEMDMKHQLRFWAHSVASAIK